MNANPEITPKYNTAFKAWKDARNKASNTLSAELFTTWLNENPEPLLSEEEHKKVLNHCLTEAERKNKLRGNVFCPIAKGACQPECESYIQAIVHGTIYEIDDETGKITIPWTTGGRCNAYILKGGDR